MTTTQDDGNRRSSFRTLLILLGVAVGIGVVGAALLFRPFSIPSVSMRPAIAPGDTVYAALHAYGPRWRDLPIPLPIDGRMWRGGTPERGDVVVFENARDGGRRYVMRVIGMPGEIVSVRDGVVHIDGEPAVLRTLDEDIEPLATGRSQVCFDRRVIDGDRVCVKEMLSETLPGGARHRILNADPNRTGMDNTRDYPVPPGHYFMLGDNRDNSGDSRTARVGTVPFDAIVGRVTGQP